jgi:endonuclease/exonuclease/phosphatase (EEP) superfamily protein YafD
MQIAFVIIGLGVVLTTVLPFVRKGYWWVRVWDFPCIQIAAIGLLDLAALLVVGPLGALQAAVAAALALAVGYQAYRIWPFTPFAALQVLPSERPDPERKLRLLVANVLVQNRQADKLLGLIEASAPDLVLTLEPDEFWARALAVLDPEYPFSLKHPQDNAYGMMLFSRLALEDAEIRFLMDEDVPSFRVRLCLRSGDRVWFHAVHPRPPHTFQATFDRDAELLVVGREIHRSPEPSIVAGDLNDVAWSYTTRMFQRISGLMDPRLGRGLYNTFNARSRVMRWPLDHIFFDPEFRLVRLERLPEIGSDHFPILADLSFEPEGVEEQEARSRMPGDRAAARRMIREARTR